MQRRIGKTLVLGLVNLAIFAAILELGAAAYYLYATHHIFYTQSRANDAQQAPTREMASRYQLHPYFGFVLRPGVSFTPGFQPRTKVVANNYGFNSPFDYPFHKTSPKQFVIGIFGGSVASNVAMYERETGYRSFRTVPAFANRDIVILNLAAGAYKQPQQLLVLNYFLAIGQQFDLVINIDGFNEAGLSYVSEHAGLDPSMPNAEQVLPLAKWASRDLSPESIELLARIYGTAAQLHRVSAAMQRSRVASTYLVRAAYRSMLQRQYDDDRLAFEESSLRPSPTDNLILNLQTTHKGDVTSEVVQLWSTSSLLMHATLTSRGIPYIHFLQPNQYYPTKRTFTKTERQLAISPHSPYRDAIPRTYPFLQRAGAALATAGVRFDDSTAIFDGERAPVYGDDCCHYGPQGADAFARHIAATMATQMPVTQR